MSDFQARYGPTAVITGAARGIGAGYAHRLAGLGFHLVLTDINAEGLEQTAAALRDGARVRVDTLALDMTDREAIPRLDEFTSGHEVGLAICNHLRPGDRGRFVDADLARVHKQIDANIRAYADFAHAYGNRMRTQGRGGLMLMSSLTGVPGSPFATLYGASKAFVLALGRAMAYELQGNGVDVLTIVPSSVNTETYQESESEQSKLFPPMEVDDFVEQVFASLGKRWVVVPGRRNALTADVLGRVLPHRTATTVMGRNMEKLLGTS
jgi:short-subunit dehydrogenase